MSEEIKEEKIRKVFLDDLPRWEVGEGKGKAGTINWNKSVGSLVKFIYNDIEGEIEIVNYGNGNLYLKYLDNSIFKIVIGSFAKCAIGGLLKTNTGDFKIEIGKVFKDNKRDLIIIDRETRHRKRKNEYKENQKWYKYKCNKCGYEEGFLEESALNRKRGCTSCSGHIIVEGYNDIPTTEPWMVKYFQGGYSEAKLYTKNGGGNLNNKSESIYPICPDCGRVRNKLIAIRTIYRTHSIGCKCGDGYSIPNKIMFNILEQLKLDFISEYNVEWIKPKSYDFYISSLNIIIEMDGGWHIKDNKLSGQPKEKSKEIDDYKDNMAKENGIEVIRIDCIKSELEYVKQNILNSKLNEIFDLSIIDWLKVEEFALSNRVKIACSYWNNGIKSTKEIAKIMKVSYATIITYLKKGYKLRWCNYDAKEEVKRHSSKNGKANRKSIEVFKDETSLGVYTSITELEKVSEKTFGVKLFNAFIINVCKGKKEYYKGFKFKYINQ